MYSLNQRFLIFRYQLLHIKSGKTQITNILQATLPDLKRYENVVKQLKTKIRDRRALLKEKNTIPIIQVFRHRELAQKITVLTEDIEKLKSEKAMLFSLFDCADDHGMDEVKQRIASMEASMEKLDQQETKYTAELNNALKEYADLKERAAELDDGKLISERLAIRPSKERFAIVHVQSAYGDRYSNHD